MSLYYDAASLITSLGNSQDASLKSLLFGKTKSDQPRKSNPNQLYALITESWKWSSVLKDVVERTGLLSLEKKLSPELALVIVHDLLLAKKGIAAPESHVLRKAVERHKARLKAEFTKARIRSGCTSVGEWELKLKPQDQRKGADVLQAITRWPHPRWLRINTLKANPRRFLAEEFSAWQSVGSLEQILTCHLSGAAEDKIYYIDEHVPNLVALPSGTDLSSIPAYKRGELISQDKASCFPAYLLSSGDTFTSPILDACAAPGNKTTHIGAIVSEQSPGQKSDELDNPVQIYATERDPSRAEVLKKMLKIAGADHVQVKAGQDFLKLDPRSHPWDKISAIILDPSCSGSGIVDRGQTMTFDLPSASTPAVSTNGNSHTSKKNRKRKRDNPSHETKPAATTTSTQLADTIINENESDPDITTNTTDTAALQARLSSLSALQTKMLTFAMCFPNVRRITYSTCSVHDIENEKVVMAALASDTARDTSWRVLKRTDQVDGLKRWPRRGNLEACRIALDNFGGALDGVDVDEVADACIRCEPFTEEGTQGFFVAGFVRDMVLANGNKPGDAKSHSMDEEEEWSGFDD